jgi:hypothetical protein
MIGFACHSFSFQWCNNLKPPPWLSGHTVETHFFFASALVGGKWSAARPSHFTLKERALGAHCIGDCVSPGTGRSGRCEEGENIDPSGNRNWIPL